MQYEASGYVLDSARWGVTLPSDRAAMQAAQELGWCNGTGFGAAPLSFQEIRALVETDPYLGEEDIKPIRLASVGFVEGVSVDPGSDLDCDPAEWVKFAGVLPPLVNAYSADAVRVSLASPLRIEEA